jgi:hypothetical protein
LLCKLNVIFGILFLKKKKKIKSLLTYHTQVVSPQIMKIFRMIA